MSRAYEMTVAITEFRPIKLGAIKQAAEEIWPFEWHDESPEALEGAGQSELCGGESEGEFAQRLAVAIWHANGKFCNVEVIATYLENLPCQTYAFDRRAFRRLATMKKGGRA